MNTCPENKSRVACQTVSGSWKGTVLSRSLHPNEPYTVIVQYDNGEVAKVACESLELIEENKLNPSFSILEQETIVQCLKRELLSASHGLEACAHEKFLENLIKKFDPDFTTKNWLMIW